MKVIKGRFTEVICNNCKSVIPNAFHDFDNMSDPDYSVVCGKCMRSLPANKKYGTYNYYGEAPLT